MRYAIIPIFLLVLVLLCPVSAQTINYMSTGGMAVYTLTMSGSSPVSATFELYRQDGTTTSGSWSYQPYYVLGFPLATTATIEMDGTSKSQVFVTPGRLYIQMYTARNLTELAESRWIMGAGQSGAINNIAVEKYGVSSPIIGFKIVADNEITYTKTEEPIATVSANLQSAGLSEIMSLGYNALTAAYAFITNLIYWLKFFFVDNLGLIIVLYISVSMALAARAARGNIGRFYSRFITQQVKLIEFIFSVWRMLIESIGTIRAWFRV